MDDRNQESGIRDQGGQSLTLSDPELVALETARTWPARRLFTNVERALEIDKIKSERGQTREFMAIRDQVLVLPVEKQEFDDSGLIVLPATAQEKQSEGIVIAVGRGRMDANNVFVATEVEPGDRVLFGKYAGTEYKLRGKNCRLMREEEILGVIR
jgi:chaperonin GroES